MADTSSQGAKGNTQHPRNAAILEWPARSVASSTTIASTFKVSFGML
jgi:hypothetical protein